MRIYDKWLDRWLPLLLARPKSRILDLGCGRGFDMAYLTEKGFDVTAVDISSKRLKCAKIRLKHLQNRLGKSHFIIPETTIINLNMLDELPFPDDTFQAIIANLSLHYFYMTETTRIIDNLQRVLMREGLLVARINSTNDPEYNPGKYHEIEKHYLLVEGTKKHFFNYDTIRTVFQNNWHIHSLEEHTLGCYGKPKIAWEMIFINMKENR